MKTRTNVRAGGLTDSFADLLKGSVSVEQAQHDSL